MWEYDGQKAELMQAIMNAVRYERWREVVGAGCEAAAALGAGSGDGMRRSRLAAAEDVSVVDLTALNLVHRESDEVSYLNLLPG